MPEQWYYLAALCISIFGMGVLDWRYKLAFWVDAKRAAQAIGIPMVIFTIWDMLGIWQGVFFHGGSRFTLPFRIIPEFPIEELFFLFLLCYVTLIIYLGGKRIWPRI
jgi:lycopene cyclase domain-containing protein